MDSPRRRILLVDDDPTEALFITTAFKGSRMAFDIRHADNGPAALREIGAFHPGLVLLDLNMPGMNGFDVLKSIKGNPETQEVATVVFTSSESRSDIDACYRNSANAYVVKPASPEGYRRFAENIDRFWFETARLPQG